MSDSNDERITDEVAALEAIMLDDVVIKRVDNVPKIIETVVHPSTGNDADLQFVCVTLEVKLTADYPDSSPEVLLKNSRGLDDTVISSIKSQIGDKLLQCLGQPVVFELIELIKENLTKRNLPSGQCAICLYRFVQGDIFIKTQCYHHFHSHCLASHLISGERYYKEEKENLPQWQQVTAPPYQQICPVCRSVLQCDVESLKTAPPPLDSITAPPFCLTAELKALQLKMAALLARQVAKGGVVGIGDNGPPPLTITTAADVENEAPIASPSGMQQNVNGAKAEPLGKGRPVSGQSSQENTPTSPEPRQGHRGPYRGFNRRGKPGRRGRGPR